jgi:hypothetical protein
LNATLSQGGVQKFDLGLTSRAKFVWPNLIQCFALLRHLRVDFEDETQHFPIKGFEWKHVPKSLAKLELKVDSNDHVWMDMPEGSDASSSELSYSGVAGPCLVAYLMKDVEFPSLKELDLSCFKRWNLQKLYGLPDFQRIAPNLTRLNLLGMASLFPDKPHLIPRHLPRGLTYLSGSFEQVIPGKAEDASYEWPSELKHLSITLEKIAKPASLFASFPSTLTLLSIETATSWPVDDVDWSLSSLLSIQCLALSGLTALSEVHIAKLPRKLTSFTLSQLMGTSTRDVLNAFLPT